MKFLHTLRMLAISVIVLGGGAAAHAAYAWDYDSGWINVSGGSSSRCVYSHHMPWVRACSVTEGPQGHSQAQWFTSDVKLPGMSFSKGRCQVQLRGAYTNNTGGADAIEDFQFTVNSRTVVIRDPNARSGFDVMTLTLPGRFTFYDGWNRLYFAGETSRGWAGSVWFGDYNEYSWGGDVLEAPGIRAIRVQCDDMSPRGPVCGNGKVEAGEQCDDGNTVSGDGCSSTCQNEVVGPTCGNGTIEAGEQCDDGNTVSGDGCSSTCQNEVAPPVCGNGKVEAGEQCDDGNTNNYDGCSSTCQTETAVCGNGITETWGGEECDDGNSDYTDACTQYCKAAVCGDGYVRSGVEQCDDGNTRNGDGCSSSCRVEDVGATCGSAATVPSCSAPTVGLCASGAPGDVTYDAVHRYWTWSCGGAKTCTTRKRCGYTEINP